MQAITLPSSVRALSPLALAALLSVAHAGAQAASLGAVQNPVFFGKPFVANVSLGNWDSDAACIKTELMYGDSPIPGTQFNVAGSTLQVKNSQVVNDVLVTLSVSVGCDGATQRVYTLFPEAPTVLSAVIQADEVQRRAEAVGEGRAKTGNTKFGRGNQNAFGIEREVADYIVVQPDPQIAAKQKRDQAVAVAQAVSQPVAQATPQAAAPSRIVVEEAAPAKGAYLELDSNLDWVLQGVGLGESNELLSLPNEAAREEARAAWAQLAAGIPGFADDGWQFSAAGRSGSLSASETLLELQQQEIDSLKKGLAQAERDKRSTLIWSGLIIGMFGVLAALLMLGRRRAEREKRLSSQTWWRDQEGHTEVPVSDYGDSAVSSSSGLAYRSKVVPEADIMSSFAEELPAPEVTDQLTEEEALSEFGISELDEEAEARRRQAAREMTEGLMDVRQQADFFMALGQYEQAETLLREYLDEHPEASSLLYLDLLQVYYHAGKEAEFEALRDHFNSMFYAKIPAFADFDLEGAGLESNSSILEKIQASWGQARVLRTIEGYIFRRKSMPADEGLDTLAFQDLLMLYALAVETDADEGHLDRHSRYVQQANNWLQTAPASLSERGGEHAMQEANGAFESVDLSLDKPPVEDGSHKVGFENQNTVLAPRFSYADSAATESPEDGDDGLDFVIPDEELADTEESTVFVPIDVDLDEPSQEKAEDETLFVPVDVVLEEPAIECVAPELELAPMSTRVELEPKAQPSSGSS